MLTLKGITLTLHSQYDDVRPIPTSDDNLTTLTSSLPASHPGAQFWFTYSCSPPGEQDVWKYMYFTLQPHQSGSAVVGWGVGAAEQWQGRTVFGLRAAADAEVERWGFFFPSPAGLDGGGWWEVRVFRCRGRRRERVGVGMAMAMAMGMEWEGHGGVRGLR